MKDNISENKTARAVVLNVLAASAALFGYGFGVYLTILADIGAGPWDVFSLGLSKTLGILYGNASIIVSVTILVIDVLMREPIGIAMFIDAVVVGKAVDFFNFVDLIHAPQSVWQSVALMLAGIVIEGYAQYFYMRTALGCGPRDTLLVALDKRLRRVPIGAISVALLALATFIGWLLGGKVGIGTLICAFATGPIMQLAFRTVRFDAAAVRHQNLIESARVLAGRLK